MRHGFMNAHSIPNGLRKCRDGITRNAFFSVPAVERFWKFVDKSSDDACWNWTGHTSGSGYKYASFWDGLRTVKGHRFAYELTFGKIPNGLIACHKCDNPLCVNPHHIFLGTQKDNMADCKRKHRMNNEAKVHLGEQHPRSTFKQLQVMKVATLATTTGMSAKEIALATGVTRTSVGAIIQGRVWGHVTGFSRPVYGAGRRRQLRPKSTAARASA